MTKRLTNIALALGLLMVAACGNGYSKQEVDALVADAVDTAVADAKDDIISKEIESAPDETTTTTTPTSTTLSESIEIPAPPSDHPGWQWDVEVQDWTCSDQVLECWEYVVEVEGFDNWQERADWDTYLSLMRAQEYPDDNINRTNAENHCGVKPNVTFQMIFEQMEAQASEWETTGESTYNDGLRYLIDVMHAADYHVCEWVKYADGGYEADDYDADFVLLPGEVRS